MGRLLLLLCVWGAVARAETTLDLTLDDGDFGPAEPIALFFDQRLTFVMPGPVALAVPGSPDVVRAHIRDNVVVVNLVDSDFVRERRPQTNLTLIGADGAPFTCRLEVAPTAAGARFDLVRVTRGAGHPVTVSGEAVALVEAWLTRGPEGIDPGHAARLEPLRPLLERRAWRRLADWVATGGIVADPDAIRRTKAAFIYLTGYGVARVGGLAVVRATLSNRSQRPFTVGDLRLFAGDAIVDPSLVEAQVPAPVVAPDGAPRGVGVVAPVEALGDGPVAIEVCETGSAPRCVRLAVR